MLSQKELLRQLQAFSGPHKDVSKTCSQLVKKDLYGSYHWPNLDSKLFGAGNAQRNTLLRFKEFGIQDKGFFKNQTVYDVGSNLGSLALEAARLGAKNVRGFEISPDRVRLSNLLANFLNCSDRVMFTCVNIDNVSPNIHPSDIVFCCAIDAYVKDRDGLYAKLFKITRKYCVFESNAKDQHVAKKLSKIGFKIVRNIGTSKSDKGYGRLGFLLKKPDV